MIQLQFLNYILKFKDISIVTLNNLTTEYFSDYKEEFAYIWNFYLKYGKVPDLETFLNIFPNFETIDVTEPPSYLLEELNRDKNKRYIASNFNTIRDLIMKDKVEDAIAILSSASEKVSSSISLQTVDIIHDKSRYESYLEKLDNYDNFYIKTGFPELDELIGGWDVKEELGTIVARPGVGKSWILLKCASAAAKQGRKVGIYSGEMSEDKVGYRLDTLIGHMSNGALIHGGASIKNEYKKYLDNLESEVPGSIKILTPRMINGPAGVNALRAFIEKEQLDILFVDQHSLLEDDRHGKTPVEKASNISRDLKLLQTMKQIPIISVSQQNRSVNEDKSFDTNLVAQSDRISQDSTIIIFIERKDDLMKLHLVKVRDSETGKVLTYRVDLNKGSFIYVNEGEPSKEVVDSNGVEYTTEDVF